MPSFQLVADNNQVAKHKVWRIWKTCTSLGTWCPGAVYALTWGKRGRPKTQHGLTPQVMDHLTSDVALHFMAPLSLDERVKYANVKFCLRATLHDLRFQYRLRGLSLKKPRRYPGPAKPITDEAFHFQIRWIQGQITMLKDLLKVPVYQIDASVFSPRKYDDRVWSRRGKPLAKPSRYEAGKYVACYAAISSEKGKAITCYKVGKAFNGANIVEFLSVLKKHSKAESIGVLLDNASIHKTRAVKAFALANGITLIYNLPYRPDLNGIEFFWAQCKAKYRREIKGLKASFVKWDNLTLAQAVVDSVPKPLVKSCAQKGWDNMAAATNVDPYHALSEMVRVHREAFRSVLGDAENSDDSEQEYR
jgi:hypothetical protein